MKDRTLLSFAATQYKRFEADVLIAAATNTLTNIDGSTDLSAYTTKGSFFNLAHQAFLRGSLARGKSPLVIQCGAFLPRSRRDLPFGGSNCGALF